MKRRLLLVGMALLAVAEAAGEELEPLVITASRVEEPASEVTATATVIEQSRFEDRAALSPSEFLQAVPGVTGLTAGTVGSMSNFFIRGSSVRQVGVLLDGVKVNRSFNDVYDFDDLLLDNVDRIEVIRGSYSSLYGSDAMGGVINIVSREGLGAGRSGRESRFSFQGGTHATFKETASVAGSQDAVDYNLAFSRTDSEGQFAHDGYLRNNIHGSGVVHLSPSFRLRTGIQFLEGEKEFPVQIAVSLVDPGTLFLIPDNNRRQSRQQTMIRGEADWDARPWWNLRVRAAAFETLFDEKDPISPQDSAQAPAGSLALGTDASIDERYVETGIQNALRFLNRSSTVIGLDYRKQTSVVDSETSLDMIGVVDSLDLARRRESYAGYAQVMLKELRFHGGDELILNAGFRAEGDSAFGTFVSPRGGMLLNLRRPYDVSLRTNYGAGVRVPNIQELFNPLFGNPDLDEEKSHSVEVGLTKRFMDNRLSFTGTLFHVQYDDLIVFGPPQAQNIDKARNLGVETEIAFRPREELQFAGNWTYTDAEKDGGGRIPLVPFHQMAARVDSEWHGMFRLFGEVHFMGAAPTIGKDVIPIYLGMTQKPAEGKTPRWHRLDLGVSSRLTRATALRDFLGESLGIRDMNVTVEVINATNNHYFEQWGFLAGDRQVQLKLTAVF